MKKFTYVVTNQSGQKQKGLLLSGSTESAKNELQNKGFMILTLEEKKETSFGYFSRPHLSLDDKLFFASNLATLVGAGITLTESLQILIEQTTVPRAKAMFEDLLHMVSAGQTLSDSMNMYPEVFSDIFINMVSIGEKSGSLVEALTYLKIQLEKEAELRKKVISAFIYPGVIVSITLMLVFGLTFFIMPKVLTIFASFDMDLPLPTRILIGFTELVTQKPIQFFGVSGLVIGLFIWLIKWKKAKTFWHYVVVNTPVFGRILIYLNLARFSRSLFSLLKAGVPISKSMEIVSKMFTDCVYAAIVKHARERVDQGASLEEALSGYPKLFPVLVVKMLTVGEKTGNLEETTEHLANMYEQNLDSLTKNLSVLLEPILLVFMGVLVGGVAIAVILPIYQLPNMISK
jgi:type II secretory pathway component PulF